MANVATAGVAAPVLSTIEDVTSVGLVFAAILLPVLVLVALVFIAWVAFARDPAPRATTRSARRAARV